MSAREFSREFEPKRPLKDYSIYLNRPTLSTRTTTKQENMSETPPPPPLQGNNYN